MEEHKFAALWAESFIVGGGAESFIFGGGAESRHGPGWVLSFTLTPSRSSPARLPQSPPRWFQSNPQPPYLCVTPAVPCPWASLRPIVPASQTPSTCSRGKSWGRAGHVALGQVRIRVRGQPRLCASGSSTDIFVCSLCRDAVCIILNLERTLHLLTGVLPAGKKKKERKERN